MSCFVPTADIQLIIIKDSETRKCSHLRSWNLWTFTISALINFLLITFPSALTWAKVFLTVKFFFFSFTSSCAKLNKLETKMLPLSCPCSSGSQLVMSGFPVVSLLYQYCHVGCCIVKQLTGYFTCICTFNKLHTVRPWPALHTADMELYGHIKNEAQHLARTRDAFTQHVTNRCCCGCCACYC